VLTDAAADGIDAAAGDDLEVRGSMLEAANRSVEDDRSPTHTVTAVEDVSATDLSGELPLVVLHLSELQSMTGSDGTDLADQVLVETEAETSTTAAESAAEDARIRTRRFSPETAADSRRFESDDFALATSLVALVVAVVICSLFVATSSALTIDRDRQAIAVLSRRSDSRFARAWLSSR